MGVFDSFVSMQEKTTGLAWFIFTMKPGIFANGSLDIRATVVNSDNYGVTLRMEGYPDGAYIPWSNIACVSPEKKEAS